MRNSSFHRLAALLLIPAIASSNAAPAALQSEIRNPKPSVLFTAQALALPAVASLPKGHLLIISSQSGAGGSTLFEHFLNNRPDFVRQPTYTTRPPRRGEIYGRDYYFVTLKQFQGLVRRGKIIAPVEYVDHWYGVPANLLKRLKNGERIALRAEIEALPSLKTLIAGIAPMTTFLITAPFFERLKRMINRHGIETKDQIFRRLYQGNKEKTKADQFDHVIKNKSLDLSKREIILHAYDAIPSTQGRASFLDALIKNILRTLAQRQSKLIRRNGNIAMGIISLIGMISHNLHIWILFHSFIFGFETALATDYLSWRFFRKPADWFNYLVLSSPFLWAFHYIKYIKMPVPWLIANWAAVLIAICVRIAINIRLENLRQKENGAPAIHPRADSMEDGIDFSINPNMLNETYFENLRHNLKGRLSFFQADFEAIARALDKPKAIRRLAHEFLTRMKSLYAMTKALGERSSIADRLEIVKELYRQADTMEEAWLTWEDKDMDLEDIAWIEKCILAVKETLLPVIGSDHRANLNVNDVIRSVSKLLNNKSTISTDLAQGLPQINASAAMLSQVMANLIINAKEANQLQPESERIEISSFWDPRRQRVAVRIKDNGPGIPLDLQSKVFDRYFSTKTPGDGPRGLGLDHAKRTIEDYGGSIELESKPNHGAQFTIYLPPAVVMPRTNPSESKATPLNRDA